MIKKITVLVILALLVFLMPATVQAGSGLTVSDNYTQVNFPYSLTFNISAESDVSITDIRLHYRVERLAFAQVTTEIYLTFTPAKSVHTQWVWDMRRTGGLPPGVDITYWWTVTDMAGSKIDTEPSLVHIEDGRYNWKTMQQGQVTLNWYEGDE